MREEREQVRKRFLGIRERLQALRASISKKEEVEAENVDPSQDALKQRRLDRLQNSMISHFKSVAEELRGLQGDQLALEQKVAGNIEGEDKLAAYEELEGRLFGELLSLNDQDITLNDLLGALTDGAVQINPGDPDIAGVGDDAIKGALLTLNASHLDDEIEGLKELQSFNEKAYEGVGNLYKKLPEGVRNTLEEIGIGASEFIAMALNFIAKYIEGFEFLRPMAKSLRSYAAEKKAKNQGISQETIDKAKEKWEPLYLEWGKRKTQNPNTTEQPPDLYTMIEAEWKEESKKGLREEQARKNTQAQPNGAPSLADTFKLDAKQNELFGVTTASVEVRENAKFSATRNGQNEWDIVVPPEGFKKVGANFELLYESAPLKDLLQPVHGVTEIKNVSIDTLFKFESESITMPPEYLSEQHLNNILVLRPNGDWQEVQIKKNDDGIAERKTGTLMVPEMQLDNLAMLEKLRDAVGTPPPSPPLPDPSHMKWKISGNGSDWELMRPSP